MILVDAVDCFVSRTGEVFAEMQNLLETYPNRKVILTGANDEQIKQFGLDKMPYEVFTLKHNPEKTEPSYYVKMLEHFNLKANDVVSLNTTLTPYEAPGRQALCRTSTIMT